MKHLWSEAIDGFGLSIGSLLEQVFYHLRDAIFVCEVKQSHAFAIFSGDRCAARCSAVCPL